MQRARGVVLRGVPWRPLDTGLSEFFKLADVNGVNGTALTNNNVATFAAGQVGNAVTLAAASSQSLSCNTTAAIEVGDFDFSVGVWVKAASLPGTVMGICGQWRGSTSLSYGLRVGTDSKPGFLLGDGSTTQVGAADAATALSQNVWAFVVGLHDAANNRVGCSLNGQPPVWSALSGTVGVGTGLFQIGARQAAAGGANAFFDGQIDALGLWKRRLLNQAEILWLYYSGVGREHPFS